MSRKISRIIIISLALLQILLVAYKAIPTTHQPQEVVPVMTRAEMEQQILASTVRIDMEGFVTFGGYRKPITNGSKSHATVMGGRYLVTHNHYKFSLTEVASPDGEGYTGLTLRKADGTTLLEHVPLANLVIVFEEAETLVLDLVDEAGNSLVEPLGLPSAKFLSGDEVPWEPGMELAQINWDEETAHVDWVKLEKVVTDQHVPLVEVDNFALKGASGGGLFWNGYHVGNTWARNLEKNSETGEVERLYTLVALNALEVVEIGG